MKTLSLSSGEHTERKRAAHLPYASYSLPVSINAKQVASVILGGGEGSRLHPLTLTRCKPAIDFGGKYRLIDIPISNSIHAGLQKIFVLTQFLSSSLHHHIFQTYMQGGNYCPIEILTAEQKPHQKSWYAGTADAVRQNLDTLLECPVDYFLILSGDQLYHFNFHNMISFALTKDADVTIAALPINDAEAARMGVLKINAHHTIVDFIEKPQDGSLLHTFFCEPELIGLPHTTGKSFLGSMGIYLFKRKALVELLQKDTRADFGKHLIPTLVESKSAIAAYIYDGYWEDIGTVESFYNANIRLTEPHPPFDLHHETRPIFSSRYPLPPSRIHCQEIMHTIVCDGGMIEANSISHSILGPRTVIGLGTTISHSYIMGNDYYEGSHRDHHKLPLVPQIGKNCLIHKAIIDKNVSLGNGVQLLNKRKLVSYQDEHLFVRDGIIIVPRGATLPDGYTF